MKIVSLKNINYKILKDFNLDFKDKDKILDLVVLAGVNGSGKTTILEFIQNKLRFFKTIEGNIYLGYKNEVVKDTNLYSLLNKYKISLEKFQNKIIYLKAEQDNINFLRK